MIVSNAAAESFFDARDRMTRGTIEVGIATGYAQATTAVGAGTSANRAAVLCASAHRNSAD